MLRDQREAEEVIHSLSGTYAVRLQADLGDLYKCTDEQYSFMFYDALQNKFYCRFKFEVRIPNHQAGSDAESQITV